MTHRLSIEEQLRSLSTLADTVGERQTQEIREIGELVLDTLRAGDRVFLCGNGGSAADAQHLAAEYVVRFGRDRNPLPALALTTDTSVLTATANDLGFSRVFSRQVEALAAEGDLLFLLSTSGGSENLLTAAEAARKLGVRTVALLAKGGGPLASQVDRALVIPTESTPRAQEMHLAVGHILCEFVEAEMFPAEEGGP
jgi:D-sedoheptulose 7-phosphate isomerase